MQNSYYHLLPFTTNHFLWRTKTIRTYEKNPLVNRVNHRFDPVSHISCKMKGDTLIYFQIWERERERSNQNPINEPLSYLIFLRSIKNDNSNF